MPGDRRPCKGRKEQPFPSFIEIRGETLPAVRVEGRSPEARAGLGFELRRCRGAAGDESDEARAELGFELRRCRGAAGDESGEARAELGFELRRCRGAAGDESDEARAEWLRGRVESRAAPGFALIVGRMAASERSNGHDL